MVKLKDLMFIHTTNVIEVYYDDSAKPFNERRLRCIGMVTPHRGNAVFGQPYGLPSEDDIDAIREFADSNVNDDFFVKPVKH